VGLSEADCSLLVMALAQPTAAESPASGGDDVVTFGFGSNMNIGLLQSKKGMRVLEHTPAVLRGWRLSFQRPALAFVEPAFADAQPGAPDDELHGVAVRLPAADYARLAAQESSYADPSVTVTSYDGRAIQARVFSMRSAPDAAAPDIACSLRYLRVLVSGAREAGLDEAYVARLAARPTYAPSAETLARRAAALAAAPIAALPSISVAALAAAWAPAPRGGLAADAATARVAVAGYVFELPRARVPFGSHHGRDITARAGRQWRGEPLDDGDDLGRPPFVAVEDRPPEERDFILCYFDAYLDRSSGRIVAFVAEFRDMLEARPVDAAT